MTKIVVDSNVLIDVLRGHEPARDRIRRTRLERDELWSITPVRTEILGGQREGEAGATRALLDLVHWHPVTIDVADRAALHVARYGRSHAGIDIVDYLLAAATELLDAELLTLNVADFPMFPSLHPAY